jgi:hypothetical protein
MVPVKVLGNGKIIVSGEQTLLTAKSPLRSVLRPNAYTLCETLEFFGGGINRQDSLLSMNTLDSSQHPIIRLNPPPPDFLKILGLDKV